MAKGAEKADKDPKKGEEEQPAEGEGGEGGEGAQPKKKNPLLLVVIALLLLGGGGGAAWYFLQPKHQAEPGTEAVAEEAPDKPKSPPVFTSLETFTVNLAGASATEHYAQVKIDLKVADSKVIEGIKLHMPEIRNSVLLLLSSKRVEDISTMEGKTRLSEEISEQINKLLEVPSPEEGVAGVLFTEFIIQ